MNALRVGKWMLAYIAGAKQMRSVPLSQQVKPQSTLLLTDDYISTHSTFFLYCIRVCAQQWH